MTEIMMNTLRKSERKETELQMVTQALRVQ